MSRPQAVWLAPAPNLARILTPGMGIDAAAFAAALVQHLHQYRIDEAMRATDATREEGVAELVAFARTLQGAVDALEPDRLASRSRALMQADIHDARRTSMAVLCERVQADLRLLIDAAERVRTNLAPAPRGRKSSTRRDHLIGVVVGMLRDRGIKASLAQTLARDILRACDVPTPVNVKRAAKQGRK